MEKQNTLTLPLPVPYMLLVLRLNSLLWIVYLAASAQRELQCLNIQAAPVTKPDILYCILVCVAF